MLKKTIVLFFLSISAHANFDLTLGAAARSWPSLGPEVNLESGYNFVFWGEGNKRNPLYGLIRPSFIIRSAAVINSLDARFEFYPISFISLALGHKYINSNWDRFNFYDCKKVRCKGEIHRDYLEFKMAMSFSGITTVGKILMSRNSYSDPNNELKPVAEFRYASLAKNGSDQMYSSRYILGYKAFGGMIGIMADYVNFEKSDETYNMDLLIYAHKRESSTYIWGIGQFVSTHWSGRGLIGVFQIKTNFLPTKKLF